MAWRAFFAVFVCTGLIGATPADAQSLEEQLKAEDLSRLARDAEEIGDAERGAVVFYQQHMACTRCHRVGSVGTALGPDLTKPNEPPQAEYLIESVLLPSKVIAKRFQTTRLITADGKVLTGLDLKQSGDQVTLKDASQPGKIITVDRDEIEEISPSKLSVMPAGQVNQLASRQQFLDLIRYLLEIGRGGPRRAQQLEPSPALYAARPLPKYEQRIDHAGMISSLDSKSFARGQKIYNRLCINCHGDHDRPGSLPTALRFAEGKFKSGSDPHTMYQTLTRGFGLMQPQTWMVPQQKYDVIHYIREAYLKEHNPRQYFRVESDYLSRLPRGDTRGPKPTDERPWQQMDYGHTMMATYEIGSGGNFAYKGIATRLDPGPGGVSRGRHWMIFDHDTLRMAGAWSGRGFIDWQGINFNGRHNAHPKIVGRLAAANPVGPGWGHPKTGSFDDPRLRGRDGKPYGPLPRDWAQYRGLYHHGQQSVLYYTVGETELLEMPGVDLSGPTPIFSRAFHVGPRDRAMVLQVARAADDDARLKPLADDDMQVVRFGSGESGTVESDDRQFSFDGRTFLEQTAGRKFNLHDGDYTITARIKTKRGGTIFAKTAPRGQWVRGGKTLFIRGGRLCFDIGWIGDVQSRRKVNDGRWHDVAMTFDGDSGQVRLYIDGRLDREGRLEPEPKVKNHVVRIGFTAPNFPKPQSYFVGQMEEVRFYERLLTAKELSAAAQGLPDKDLHACWKIGHVKDNRITDSSQGQLHADVVRGSGETRVGSANSLIAGLRGTTDGLKWKAQGPNLRLTIPAGDQPLRFAVWFAVPNDDNAMAAIRASARQMPPVADLQRLTAGGPSRYPQVLKTKTNRGTGDGPFATDVLARPVNNPWFAQLRLSGFDFLPGGKEMAVCTWDGDVWLVAGIDRSDGELSWRRIATGLFQPLGLKVVDGRIYVGCRDQIVVLRDQNGDGETDYYECFNNDHQVTEHFHEFAMGLQTDKHGNFYYAKSARHALKALVPHHGTLLRVSKDGARTDILATGFRAANGVCLNPDGTFIVTDQEGHWNPKNRINWVRPGGFYGNMYGYHDVTDSSDEAMEQPLCWITNAFDRSPAELLWVTSDRWGPLQGSLLNLSYGYGKIYVVPHENVGGQMQGGMCELPLPQFPTGVMRGRFHPDDGQLYTCGLFAWAGNQRQPGGLYRVRYTGKPVHVPVGLKARRETIELTFSGSLQKEAAENPDNFAVKVWSLRRSARYGSPHINERTWKVTQSSLAENGKTVRLTIPALAPTWCMEIVYSLKSVAGQDVQGKVHNTVHRLGEK